MHALLGQPCNSVACAEPALIRNLPRPRAPPPSSRGPPTSPPTCRAPPCGRCCWRPVLLPLIHTHTARAHSTTSSSNRACPGLRKHPPPAAAAALAAAVVAAVELRTRMHPLLPPLPIARVPRSIPAGARCSPSRCVNACVRGVAGVGQPQGCACAVVCCGVRCWVPAALGMTHLQCVSYPILQS